MSLALRLPRGATIARELFYALPLALMFLLALTPGISFTEDLGRHLLLGKIIVATGHVPDTNLLTYTYPDFPFINHHWLSEVIFYFIHCAVGQNGLILLKALLMCATLAFVMHSVPLRHVSPLIVFAATLAAIALGYRAHIRPEIFTYLGVALYGWLIARLPEPRRAQLGVGQGAEYSPARKLSALSWAIIIAYGWFWANAHIYFIFGIGMIFSYWLARWWHIFSQQKTEMTNERSGKTWLARVKRLGEAWPRTETIGLISLIGVSLINPNGWHGLLYPLGIFGNYGMGITENASPLSYWETVLNPMLIALPFLSLCALWVFWRVLFFHRNMTAGQLAGVLILFTALIASWCMARSAPLLALTLLPPLSLLCARRGLCARAGEAEVCTGTTKSTWRSIRRKGMRFAGITVVVALNLWLAFAVVGGSYSRIFPSPIGPTPFGFDDESRYLALRRLRADGLPTPLFSDYNSGSLVEYNLYPERGYVDNRPEAFPAAFWQKEYLPALALGKVWNDTITQRGIQTVAVSTAGVKEHFVRVLFTNPHWRLVHLDFFFAVFTRNTPENQDFLRRHAFGEKQIEEFAGKTAQHIRVLSGKKIWQRQILADQIVYEIYGLICLGRNDLAWPLVWEMHLRYPDYQLVHELMRVSAPPHAWPAVMEVMNSHARWPLAAKQVLDYGAALEAQGRTNEAYRVYRRGKIFFPLCPNLRN